MIGAYPAFGALGLLAAIAVIELLAAREGLSALAATALIAVSVATLFALLMAVKIVTGGERNRYLDHQMGLLVTVPLAAWALGQPVLRSLDIVLMGLGTMLAFTRVGCLMEGCCHGKPGRWGVRYGDAHVAHGFRRELAYVRLLPVQLAESVLVLALVAAGVALVLSDAEPGSAAALYVVGYGLLRFSLELLRGDRAHPYPRGYSAAQWIVLALMAATVALEASGVLPFALWHAVALVALVALVGLWRPPAARESHHVRELGAIVARLEEAGDAGIRVHRTSLGVGVSAGLVERDGTLLRHYSLSHADPALARVVGRLAGAADGGEVVPGGHGVLHVLVPIRD